MKSQRFLTIAFAATALFATTSIFAQESEMEEETIIEDTEMSPSTNIIEFASQSKDHTTLVAAIKAAGLVETLSGDGPFTVFAPTNAAFADLPEGTVASLLKPENKKQLAGVLTYHVIAGKINSSDLVALLEKNNGRASVPTVAGKTLTFYTDDGDVYIEDANGNTASITMVDADQTNGVIHVIDAVLLPKK